ncbi:MAG: hypothetical protein GY733_02715 [bacterium]|nr:hypothetical protein [bacterium]
MRPSILTIAVCLLFCLLPSCKSDEGGSSGPGLNIAGFWSGYRTPDGGAALRVNVVFKLSGDPKEGSVFASVRFPTVFGFRPTCPEKVFNWAATLEGNEMDGKWHAPAQRERYLVEVEFPDDNTAIGTYEVLETPGSCAGETGTIELDRWIE